MNSTTIIEDTARLAKAASAWRPHRHSPVRAFPSFLVRVLPPSPQPLALRLWHPPACAPAAATGGACEYLSQVLSLLCPEPSRAPTSVG